MLIREMGISEEIGGNTGNLAGDDGREEGGLEEVLRFKDARVTERVVQAGAAGEAEEEVEVEEGEGLIFDTVSWGTDATTGVDPGVDSGGGSGVAVAAVGVVDTEDIGGRGDEARDDGADKGRGVEDDCAGGGVAGLAFFPDLGTLKVSVLATLPADGWREARETDVEEEAGEEEEGSVRVSFVFEPLLEDEDAMAINDVIASSGSSSGC